MADENGHDDVDSTIHDVRRDVLTTEREDYAAEPFGSAVALGGMIVRLSRIMTGRQILRDLLRLAIPLMLGNLFYSLQIVIDRAFLSRFHPEAPGAALAAAVLIWVLIVCLQNTAGFAVTFVAQYVGAGRDREVGAVVWQGIWIGLVGGLLCLLAAPFSYQIAAAIGHSEQLQIWEAEYFRCLCFTAAPVAMQAAACGFFSGRGQTQIVIAINAIGCVINLILGPIWIFGWFGFPEGGVTGAGWATVVACIGTAATAIFWMTRPQFEERYGTRSNWRPNRKLLVRLLQFAGPNGLQAAADIIAWSAFTLMVGWMGATELAATSVVFMINSLFFIPMIGLGQAAGVFVGQKLGEERPDLAERGVHIGVLLTIAFMGVMGLLTALSPGLVLSLFANRDNPEQWQAVAKLVPGLLWFLAVYSIFDGLNVMFAFSLRGAGDTRFVSLAFLLVGTFGLIVPLAVLVKSGGTLYQAWAVATVYLVLLTAVIGARFQFGPWKSMRVIEATP